MQPEWQSHRHSRETAGRGSSVQTEKLQDHDNHDDYTDDVEDVVHKPSGMIRLRGGNSFRHEV
jgi:hypothetical protein